MIESRTLGNAPLNYYRQDDRFNASHYFSKLRGEEKPESGNRTLGASIGGPIIKNKAVVSSFVILPRGALGEDAPVVLLP